MLIFFIVATICRYVERYRNAAKYNRLLRYIEIMNPRERILSAVQGKPVDRVPLILEGFHYVSNEDVDDQAKLEIINRIGDQLHFSYSVPGLTNRYLVTPQQRITEIGSEVRNGNTVTNKKINTPKGPLTFATGRNKITNTTWAVKYPVESLKDVEKISSVPWELPTGLAAPDMSTLPDSFPTRGIVRTSISSPFVCVAGMMPFQYFFELCATDLRLIKDLTQVCLERIFGILEVILSEGTVDYVWIGGSEWVTPPMGSPRLFEELVQPFERQLIEEIHAAGAVSHIHCHGNVRSTLELAIERGGDFFEPVEPPPDGDITFAEAKKLAGGRITLGGNVEARILENENADAVEKATRAAFEGGKDHMVLQTTAGPISKMTPKMVENYHRMIDVWQELSPI